MGEETVADKPIPTGEYEVTTSVNPPLRPSKPAMGLHPPKRGERG
jgi:hypothetical protein